MKRINGLRLLGLGVAVVLIVFGGVGNLMRTVRFAVEKWLNG